MLMYMYSYIYLQRPINTCVLVLLYRVKPMQDISCQNMWEQKQLSFTEGSSPKYGTHAGITQNYIRYYSLYFNYSYK